MVQLIQTDFAVNLAMGSGRVMDFRLNCGYFLIL